VNLKLAFYRLWCVGGALALVTATVLAASLIMVATAAR
jgi:hypothetical protein